MGALEVALTEVWTGEREVVDWGDTSPLGLLLHTGEKLLLVRGETERLTGLLEVVLGGMTTGEMVVVAEREGCDASDCVREGYMRHTHSSFGDVSAGHVGRWPAHMAAAAGWGSMGAGRVGERGWWGASAGRE